MTRPRMILLGPVLAVLAAVPAGAQETLRYRWIDDGTVTIESPQGTMDVVAEQYAEVTFELDDGEAVARFDSLTSYIAGPMGDQSPDVGPLREGEFRLEIDDANVVTTVDHPSVAASGTTGLDPLHTFDDFFIPLPEESLTVGLEWSRDFVHEGSSAPGGEYYSERSMTLSVRADTVVNGVDAFVVDVSQTLLVESAGIEENMGFDFRSTMEGTESGMAILTADGRLLHRSRTMDTTGLFSMSFQGQAMDMPQAASFTGTIDLVSN